MGEDNRNMAFRDRHVRQLMKTELCRYFIKNKCNKGSQCAFGHSLMEIREKPDLNCTSMCRTFLQTGNCDDRNCTYAHDERQLRTTAGFFKTKLCRFADRGRCMHGSACRFAHAVGELALHHPELALQMGNRRSGNANTLTLSGGTGDSSPGLRGVSGGSSSGGDHSNQGDAAIWQVTAQGDWADSTSDPSESTRAETSFSVATHEGNGDSGQEEPANGTRNQQRRNNTMDERNRRQGAPGRSAPAQGGDRQKMSRCTTMMITNVPSFLTQGALVSLLEDLTVCMRGTFDFFYCPWDPNQDRNLGHAIVNFYSKSIAAHFERQWQDQFLLPRSHEQRRLRIVPAALQGRAANLKHFSGFSLAHHADPRFRPLVRAAPNQALRPMAIPEECGQPSGAQQQGADPPHDHAQSYWQPPPMQDHGQGMAMQETRYNNSKVTGMPENNDFVQPRRELLLNLLNGSGMGHQQFTSAMQGTRGMMPQGMAPPGMQQGQSQFMPNVWSGAMGAPYPHAVR